MVSLLVKLGATLLRTAAKPLSLRFEAYVMRHPAARSRAIHMAQVLHRAEVWISRASEGKTGPAFVGDMTEAKSLELASRLVSEGFIFGVGLVVVVLEYERQRHMELLRRAKEAAERQAVLEVARQEHEALARDNREQVQVIQTLMGQVEQLEQQLRQLV